MFWLASVRVNDQSQFTFARMVGEFRLYVHPDGLQQNWWLSRSTGAKRQQMPSSSAFTVHCLENARPRYEHVVDVGVDGVGISSEQIELDAP